MRVLLVHPRFPYRGRDAFPIGLGYLAAVARDMAEVDEVVVVDENVAPLDLEGLARDPPDLLGITSTTPSFPRALEIAGAVRGEKTMVVMGGTHVTFCPEDALGGGVDVVVRGEGEHAFRELLEGKELMKIRGISYLGQGGMHHNPGGSLVEELDSLPFPAWELFPLHGYGVMSVVTSRGCPYSCSYCCASRFWGRRVRYRSPENVLEELRHISALGYERVRFMDSTFTLDKKRVLRICELIREELDLRWSCETRADALDRDVLRALAASGCTLLCLGVDSGSQRVLDETGRGMRVSVVKKAFERIREYGIATRAYVTFGFPGESEQGVRETLRLLEELKPDQVILSLATAYPGTELWGEAEVELPESWVAKFHGHGRGARIYLPRGMTRKDYMRLADYLWRGVKRLNRSRLESK